MVTAARSQMGATCVDSAQIAEAVDTLKAKAAAGRTAQHEDQKADATWRQSNMHSCLILNT